MTAHRMPRPGGVVTTAGPGRHPTDPLEYTVTNHTDQHERTIRAPWSSGQVAALNAFQECGGMHPFTCGNLHASGQSPVLEASSSGWFCPDPACDYRQDWAHAFMVDRGRAAASAVRVPATDQTADREQIAAAVRKQAETGNVRYEAIADAVLAVLTEPADRAAVFSQTERDMLRYALDLAQDQIHSRGDEFTDEDQAAVDSLRRLAGGSAGRVADDTQPETLRPAATEWTFEACYDADNDKWHGIGGTYSAYAEAKDAFKRRAENDSDHVKHFKFRLVRATTTYTVEAERAPTVAAPAVGGAQQPQEDRIVAYRHPASRALHCLACAPTKPGDIWDPVTAEDLEDGGLCAGCGVDVLIEQQPQEDEQARPECAHCWREIENRGAPSMDGNHHVHWVHIPGGFQYCFPQRPDSPRAEPRTTEAPS